MDNTASLQIIQNNSQVLQYSLSMCSVTDDYFQIQKFTKQKYYLQLVFTQSKYTVININSDSVVKHNGGPKLYYVQIDIKYFPARGVQNRY